MALFNESQLRSLAKVRLSEKRGMATDALNENIKAASVKSSFDIFLSHSYLDKELILGLTLQLEKLGYQVYVDWREDAQLSRDNVTKETAEAIRLRITQSKSLFFATTEGAKDSRWMPWELGYMDGQKRRSAILPVSISVASGDTYKGREYLGIYPYITHDPDRSQKERLWVHESAEKYISFDRWLTGEEPYKH